MATEIASKSTLEYQRESQRGRLKKQIIIDLAEQCSLQTAITMMEAKEKELREKGMVALEALVRMDRLTVQKILAQAILADMVTESR